MPIYTAATTRLAGVENLPRSKTGAHWQVIGQRKIAVARKRLFDFCVAKGLKSGQQDYVKFIILGRGRSGSNWLRTLLNSHPNVVAFGELFNNSSYRRRNIGWAVPGYRPTTAQLNLREQNPIEFIRKEIFAPMPVSVRAVGFKLFYYHARTDDRKIVWDYLKSLEPRVLQLKRRNLLAVYLSRVIADETRQWSGAVQDSTGKGYELDYDECVRFFEQITRHEKEFSDFFPGTLTVCYEDMLADFESEMRRVLDYLGVRHASLASPLQRQRKRTLRETITNFEELKERFSDTPYEVFFEQ